MSRDITGTTEKFTATTREDATAGGAGAGTSAGAVAEAGPTAALLHIIPNRIHFIWLGVYPLPAPYFENILSCHTLNAAHYQTHLWINPEYFSTADDEKYSPFNSLAERGIKLRNYQDLKPKDDRDSSTTDSRSFLLRCVENTHLKRPVVASDILRVLILADEEEGGIYFDTDTQFKRTLDPEIAFLNSTTFIIDHTATKDDEYGYTLSFCNSLLASVAGGREAHAMLLVLERNLKSLLAQSELMLEVMGKSAVIKNTGPGIYQYLCKLDRLDGAGKHCEQNFSRLHYTAFRGFKSHQYDGSWLRNPSCIGKTHASSGTTRGLTLFNHSKAVTAVADEDRDAMADEMGAAAIEKCSCISMKAYYPDMYKLGAI